MKAAIYTGNVQHPFTEVGEIPTPDIGDHQILVKTVAVAANPTDWKHIAVPIGGEKGHVTGTDVAGIAEKVGANVTRVKVGDYVGAILRGNSNFKNGAFAEYVAVDENATLVFPKDKISSEVLTKNQAPGPVTSFEAIASVPLGLATVGVSYATNFQLQPGAKGTLLIWGGATATGVLAIQVAKIIYGVKVITTASKKHHEFLRSIGADATFDYHDADVIDQIKTYAQGSIAYALDTVSSVDTLQQTYDATEGSDSVIIDNLLSVPEDSITQKPGRKAKFTLTWVYLIAGGAYLFGKWHPAPPGFLDAFNHFWTELLIPVQDQINTTKLTPLAPGFESVNTALDLLQRDQVSGEKLVFRLK